MTETHSDTQAAVERLDAWLNDFSVGRYERPTYANPGELKADLRVLLSALAEAERERDENEGVFKVWRRRTEMAEARIAKLEAALERVQQLLCAFGMSDQDRHNAVAGVVHEAILEHCGGYSEEAVARRRAALAAAEPSE